MMCDCTIETRELGDSADNIDHSNEQVVLIGSWSDNRNITFE